MRRLLVVTALAALLVSGCGIPEDTKVTVVGPGPSGGTAAFDDSIPAVPNTRESATDATQLLKYYLEAAAGDPDTVLDRVKAFMSPEARESYEAGPDVKVIRLKGAPLFNTPDSPLITFNAQVIGILKPSGSLEPATDNKITEFQVRVGRIAGQSGFFILQTPPHQLLLTDTALDNFYERRTIYFWNNENTALIPDLRYMPRGLPSTQQPTTILRWLVNDGPAPWLADAAHGLPDGTAAPENVPAATNDTLTVSLNSQAAGDAKALDRLRRQLQWSLLRPRQEPHILDLKIGKQEAVRYSDIDYRSSNPAYRLLESPERFVVYNGVIRRIVKTPQAGEPIPVLRPEDNKGIVAAAMSTSSTHTFAAVVTGSGKNSKLRVAAARTGEQAGLTNVPGLSGSLGRPVWTVNDDDNPLGAVGLITMNHKLYSFAPNGSAAKPVVWQTDPGPVQAISVAPDGYRVAVVAGGKLYRATLGASGGGVTISSPERLYPPTLKTISAVAWSSETYLAVAGLREDGPRYAVMDVSVDGAVPYTRLEDIGKSAVTYLTAYPSNPVTRGENADTESYEAANDAWDVLGEPVKITVGDLAGAPATPQAGMNPTAPFFLD